MPPIPVYLKSDADAARPGDDEFYWLTQNGAFLCRNHPFFTSDVPTRRPVKALAPHEAGVVVRYPKVKAAMLETIVGFFHRAYELHGSESVVLLLWDVAGRRYRLLVPDQEATVWQSWGGQRFAHDVRYKVPPLQPGHLLVGDVHCHGDMAAYASFTDRADEVYRDGVHGVVGRVERDPPDFHLELAIDGHRFPLEMDQVFERYGKRRTFVPKAWLDKVRVKVEGLGGRPAAAWSWAEDDWAPRRNQRE